MQTEARDLGARVRKKQSEQRLPGSLRTGKPSRARGVGKLRSCGFGEPSTNELPTSGKGKRSTLLRTTKAKVITKAHQFLLSSRQRWSKICHNYISSDSTS